MCHLVSQTHDGGYKPFNRTGMATSNSPFLKSSFETTGQVITDSVLSGDFDDLQNPSASLVVGKIAKSGTGIFSVMADLRGKPQGSRDY
jgi:DNA-directed RNA polymerase I subunit RPA1